MEDKKTDTVTGIPVLSKIPGLGMLFRRKVTDKSKTELLIFLTPHVAQDASGLKPMTVKEIEALKIVPKAVAPGTFQEHMEGMDRGGNTPPVEDKKNPDEKSR